MSYEDYRRKPVKLNKSTLNHGEPLLFPPSMLAQPDRSAPYDFKRPLPQENKTAQSPFQVLGPTPPVHFFGGRCGHFPNVGPPPMPFQFCQPPPPPQPPYAIPPPQFLMSSSRPDLRSGFQPPHEVEELPHQPIPTGPWFGHEAPFSVHTTNIPCQRSASSVGVFRSQIEFSGSMGLLSKDTSFGEVGYVSCMSTKEDELSDRWLAEWVKKVETRAPTKHTSKNLLTFPEMRQMTEELERLHQKLRSMVIKGNTSSPAVEVSEILELKGGITDIESVLCSEDNRANLIRKICRAKRNRLRLKRKRYEEYLAMKGQECGREKIRKEIDQWMAKITQDLEQETQAANMKADADRILADVRRKTADMTKSAQLVKSLWKLRALRKATAEKKGVSLPVESDAVFEAPMARVEREISSQRDIYDREQATMQAMLETEQEETHKKASGVELEKFERSVKKSGKAWDKAWFGDVSELDVQLLPANEYFLQAANTDDAFFSIRHQWDAYIVQEPGQHSSQVPVQWLDPPAASNNQWKKYLIENSS